MKAYFNKRLLILFLASSLILTLSSSPVFGNDIAPRHLNVGIYNNPPKLFIDENKHPKGIFPGIITAIAQKEGWKIKFIPLSFKEGLTLLEKGQIDIMQDVAWSQKRSRIYRFTNETVMISWGRVYQKKGGKISTLIDLKDKRIAYMDGGIYSEGTDGLKNLMKKFELNATFIPVRNYQQVFEYIDQGKADAGVVNRLYGKTNKIKYQIDNTPVLISPISIRLAFNKSNPITPHLIQTIDKHLIQFKNDENSVYYQLIDEYIREPRKVIPGFLKPLLISLFILLGILAALGFVLNRQSQKKTDQLQKQEKELKESEKKFRTIFENLQDVYFEIDLSHTIKTISPSAERILGLSLKELLNSPIDKIFKNAENQAQCFEQLMETGAIRDFHFHYGSKPGQWLSMNADLYHDENKTPVGIRGILRDISQQKNTEAELKKREERFREMARLLPCGIVETDTHLNITYANQAGLDMFNLTHSDIKKGLNGNDFIHPDERDIPFKRIKQHQKNQPLSPVEFKMIKKDGSLINVLWNSTPIITDGKVCGIRGSLVDLTELKQLQEQVLRTQKLESTGILAGGIAHDFNNILLGLFGNITLAKSELSPQNPAYKLIEEAEKSMSRAKNLTTQLLTFAQGGDPIKQALTIDQVIRETAAFNLAGSNIRIIMEKPEELWKVRADKGQISQVISNLVINARQAMPDGGDLRIKLENTAMSENEYATLKLDRYVKISLTDEGCGIPEVYLEKIFDPYFTTKQDGSGLGLAIVHSIVLKHLGYIYVNSDQTQGTTFVIYLPAADKEEYPQAPPEPMVQQSIKKGHLKILLMDDDDLVKEVSERILNKLGHDVILCSDGTQAIKSYEAAFKRNTPYDMVIMDLTIPGGMGGQEAVTKLLKIDPDAKVIVASGYSTDPVMAKYKTHGFKGMITKPYTVEKMEQVIDNTFFS